MKHLTLAIYFFGFFMYFNSAQAATWFLPDWQASSSSRSDTDKGGGDFTGGTCEQTYGLSSSCAAPQIIKKSHNIGKIICYECQCPSSYQYTSCNPGYVLAGGTCNGKYLRCDVAACPAGYTPGLTCSSGYNREVNGKSGSLDCAKCNIKACASGYSAGLANCKGQSQPAGWNYSSNGYSGSSICGKCIARTCPSGFTAGVANCNGQAQPSGWTHSSNGYSGNSICGKCTAKTCPSGFTAGVASCSDTTSWSYGSNGYAGNSICGKCSAKACDTGFTAGLANCNSKTHPTGWVHSTSAASGTTVCGKCTAKTTCTSGSTSCNSSTQNATANGYYVGDSPCYTCTNKTCEQMGKKTCNGSCIATTQCCGGCGTGQRCSNGTCVEIPCESCFQKEACNSYQAVGLVQSSNPNCHTCKITATGSNAMICVAIGGTCRSKCKGGETARGKCAVTQKCCLPEDPCQCSSYAQPVCADGQTKSYNSCTSSLWKCEGTACESGYSTTTSSCASGYSLTAQSTNAKCKKCVSSCNSGYKPNLNCPAGYQTQTQSTNPICKKCVCIDSNTCVCNSQGGTCLKSCPMGYAKIGMCGTSSNICCVQM